MRGEELIDLFEDLDDELIEEAATATLLPTYQKRRTLLIACACALLVLSAPVFFLFSGLFKGADIPTQPNMGGQSSKMEASGDESAPMDGSLAQSDHGEESLLPPEESIPPGGSIPYDESEHTPPPAPTPSEEEYAPVLSLKMHSSFEIYKKAGEVTQVTALDSESGEEILAELKAEGKDPTGDTLENALVWLFAQMLERGEHQENDTVTLALLAYEDGEEQKTLLEEGADALSRLAESKNAVIRIITEGAVG